MTTSRITLGYRDGWLCAVETTTRSQEPVQDTLYWPLFRDQRSVWEFDLGKPLRSDGQYTYRMEGSWRRFQLARGGQTTSLACESAPVPKPPRIRVPVRWEYGRWQKYDRKKGWVTACLAWLLFALAMPAAGAPTNWYRIEPDPAQPTRLSCQNAAGNTPRDFMVLAGLERTPYRMEDVEEHGQVVETTMRSNFGSYTWTLRPNEITWYLGQARCEHALRTLREGIKQELQRREKYR